MLAASFWLLVGVTALASPLPQTHDEGLASDFLHDFLLQQAFEPEKAADPVYEAHDVLRYTDEGQDPPQDTVILPQEHQVEAGVAFEEAHEPQPAPIPARGLLGRNRGSRRFPNRQNRITPAEEVVVYAEQPTAPQQEEAPVEVEPQEAPNKRRGSRFPLRSRPGSLLRGRNRDRGTKKPTTTTTVQPETEPAIYEDEVPQQGDFLYPDYPEEDLTTTTPKPRGILARRRSGSRAKNRNALFEALRNRRKQYRTSTTTTPKPAPSYDDEYPTAAEDSKATARRTSPTRRFGSSRNNRRRFRPRPRASKQEPEAQPVVEEEVPAQEPERQQRSHKGFRSRHLTHQS